MTTTSPAAQSNSADELKRTVMPFVDAVREVFRKMVGVEAVVQAPYIKRDRASSYEVCGIIGFSGQTTGAVVLSFSERAAVKLVECFAGAQLALGDPDFADAIGELANMVAGSAKRHLNAEASISVPSVVIGRGYTVAAMSDTPCIVIPCTSTFGDFAVEVCLKTGARKRQEKPA